MYVYRSSCIIICTEILSDFLVQTEQGASSAVKALVFLYKFYLPNDMRDLFGNIILILIKTSKSSEINTC